MQKSTNLQKHTSQNPLQQFLIKRLQDAVAYEVKRIKPRSLLSVGCGEGFDLKHILEIYKPSKVVGVDFDSDALAYARKQLPKVEFKRADARKLPFSKNQFDLVIALEVIEHIQEYDPAISELVRVSSGPVIITVPWEPAFSLVSLARGKYLGRLGRHPEHVNAWNKKTFAQVLEKHNLEIRKHKIIFPWQFCLVYKKDAK